MLAPNGIRNGTGEADSFATPSPSLSFLTGKSNLADGGAAVGFLYGWRDCLDEIKIIRIILPSSIRINATERNIFFALQASDYSAFAVKLIWRWVFVRKYVFGGVWIRRAGVLNHYFGGSLVWLYDLNENVSLLHLSLQLRQVLTRNSNKI